METNENGFTNKGHKEKANKKIDYKKANKKKIKISLKRNLMSRPNKKRFEPRQ
jgi:hypothetical protein